MFEKKEFTGEKLVSGQTYKEYYSNKYVEWLEERIMELEEALNPKRTPEETLELIRRIEQQQHSSRSRWDTDYDSVPYDDGDRDR